MPSTAQVQNEKTGLMGGVAHFPTRHSKETITPLVFSNDQAAAMAGVSPRTMQNMRLDGTGPEFVMLTKRRIGYTLEALRAWIASRSVKSTSDATTRFGGVA